MPSGRIPGVIRISAQWLKDHGFLDRLVRICEQGLNSRFVSGLYKSEVKQNQNQTGARFHPGPIFLRHEGYDTLSVGRVSRSKEIDTTPFIVELTDIVSEITKIVIPDVDNQCHKDRWHGNGSLTIGSRKNHQYTNIQLNYTKQETKLTDGLGVRGGIHRDVNNDPTMLTAIVALSSLSNDYFGGRFNITSLNVSNLLF